MTSPWVFAEETTAAWQTYGAAVLWIAGLGTALGVIWHLPIVNRPLRWLWRHLISTPISEWTNHTVSSVLENQMLTGPLGAQMAATTNLAQDGLKNSREILDNWATYKSDQADTLAMLANIHDCIDRRFTESNARLAKLSEFVEEALDGATASTERIRQLYRSLDIAIFEADSEGLCVYVNPAYSEMTGLSYGDSLGGGWMEAVVPPERDRVERGWKNAVNARGDFNAIFRVHNVMTQHDLQVKGSAMPLHNGSKQVVGWIGTLDPVSDSILSTTPTSQEGSHA